MNKNRKKKWIVTGSILLVFCGGLWLYNRYGKTDGPIAPTEAPVATGQKKILNVNGLVLRPQTFTDAISVIGNLLPDEEVDLSFETSGKIVEINFREGTPVRKGDLLAKVNDRPLQAQLSRYEAQLKLAEDRVYRQSALLEKDAVSQEAYEQARTELAILNADIAIVRSNIALTELRAPFDGVIGLRNVSEGAYASPSVVVAKLTRIAPLKIDFYIPERYANQIRPGTPLTFTVEGRNETFRAMVYATESKIDPTTHLFSVRATTPTRRGCSSCRAASPRCASSCRRFPTQSPYRPRPSYPKWAWRVSSATATAAPRPSRYRPACAPTPRYRSSRGSSPATR